MTNQFKFKIQTYQTNAVESVIDCFAGQVFNNGISYRIDPGKQTQMAMYDTGFKNADVQLTGTQLIDNIRNVQRRQNLPLTENLVVKSGTNVNLDIEMETGTGKTYCYI